MNAQIWISAFTALVITGGGALGIAFTATKGAAFDKEVWILAAILGAVSAAKDIRSQLKLPPPSNGTGNTETITKP